MRRRGSSRFDIVQGLVMGVFNVHDAKTHFSRLLDRVAQGEEIIIAKSGRPVAKLVGWPPSPASPGG